MVMIYCPPRNNESTLDFDAYAGFSSTKSKLTRYV
jgi:hypothetical protein